MEYRNKKTGFTFFSNCKIGGADWEIVTDEKEKEGESGQKEKQEEGQQTNPSKEVPENDGEDDKSTGDGDIDTLNKNDIIQELEAMGIKHNPRAKKQELYDLMMSQGKGV